LKSIESFIFPKGFRYAILAFGELNNNGGINLISFLKNLIRCAGDICLKEQNGLKPDDVEFKTPKDLVTVTDKKVESFIIQEIKTRYPEHDILGEETGRSGRSSRFLWIIDPIDGTTSFFHGQPFYGVSIALRQDDEIILGAVYAPVLDQLFHAQKGKGAFLNDLPINVSCTKKPIDAVMATGFACLRSGLENNNLVHFNKIVPQLRDIRRYGSAAIDLCYVACGKLDGFWEMNLNVYDIAAGALMVKEAGGKITDFSGGGDYPAKGILAANSDLHPFLMKMLEPEIG
jgi:myo-inositol-1(or 4)-monophosphatase